MVERRTADIAKYNDALIEIEQYMEPLGHSF